jgi:hypothetical protein
VDQTQDTIKLKATAAAKSWTRFAVLYLAVFFIGSAAILLLILAIDPYDSGRFPSLRLVGIVDENPRTAVVSRGRDAQFKAAVVGNSHGQLLSPARLSQATGVRFVQLTVPGTGPREQFAVMRWFARHHARIGALVLVADLGWCTQDAKLPMVNPFPFWLYSESDLEYLSNIFSTRSLDLGFRRVMLALGWRTPSDPAGYWDYEAGRPWTFNPPIPEEQPPAASRFEREFSFPAILPLSSHVERLPARTPLIIVMAPIFFTELPRAGSEDAARLAQCKQALARLAAARPGSAFLDYLLDTPMTRDPKNFMDAAHYRADVAKRIEADIARALAAVPAAR